MQDTKKVAGELLVELEKKGVTFETVDGKLKYKDSKGNFTENSKEKVKKYKEEIIEILKKKQTIDEFITDNDYETSHTPQVWIDCQIVDEIDSEDQEKGLMISWDTRKGAIKESIVTEMFESFTETIRILGIKHSEEWKNPLEIIVPSASRRKAYYIIWKSFAWTVDGSCRRGIENLSGICFGANCHRRIFFGRRLFRRYNINKRKICLSGRRKEQDLSHWR